MKNLCNRAGRCLVDSQETDGFRCECFDQYYGEYCQYNKNGEDMFFV